MKQYSYVILAEQAYNQAVNLIVSPSGEFIEVQDNDGNTVSKEIYYGGFVYIGELVVNNIRWIALLGAGLKEKFDLIRSSLQQITDLTGNIVGLEISTINSDDTFDMQENPSEEKMAQINTWLSLLGKEQITNDKMTIVIEQIFGLFRDGFKIGQDSIV